MYVHNSMYVCMYLNFETPHLETSIAQCKIEMVRVLK